MKESVKVLVFCIILISLTSCGINYFNVRTPSQLTSTEIATCIRDIRCHRIFPVAHRGSGVNAPENSRESTLRSIQAGVPVIETDLRLSKDGIVYVLYDGHLDRTTDSTGSINEKTSRVLNNVFLKNGETVPVFTDIYSISRGRAVLDLHIKDPKVIRPTAEWIARNGSFDDVIFFVRGDKQMMIAAELKHLYPKMIIMARIVSWSDLDNVRKIFNVLPEIIHVSSPFPGVFQITRLHLLGVKVFGNAWIDAPLFSELKYLLFLPLYPDFIQSDNPAALKRILGN